MIARFLHAETLLKSAEGQSILSDLTGCQLAQAARATMFSFALALDHDQNVETLFVVGELRKLYWLERHARD
ncbi:MAG TPA: hypothetical protein VNN22_14225 [Verrucomicrobiae bacterium]|nr:hypothetical protein [Verrucomicrobiae bacterium]